MSKVGKSTWYTYIWETIFLIAILPHLIPSSKQGIALILFKEEKK